LTISSIFVFASERLPSAELVERQCKLLPRLQPFSLMPKPLQIRIELFDRRRQSRQLAGRIDFHDNLRQRRYNGLSDACWR
jgi:hypothetical protein